MNFRRYSKNYYEKSFSSKKNPNTKTKRDLKYSVQASSRKKYNKSQKADPGYLSNISKCKKNNLNTTKHQKKQSIDIKRNFNSIMLKSKNIYNSPYDAFKDKDAHKSISGNSISKLIKKTKISNTAGKKVDYAEYLSVNPTKNNNFERLSEGSKYKSCR